MYCGAQYPEAHRTDPGQAIPTEVRLNLGPTMQAIPEARRTHHCPRLQQFPKMARSGCQRRELTCAFEEGQYMKRRSRTCRIAK